MLNVARNEHFYEAAEGHPSCVLVFHGANNPEATAHHEAGHLAAMLILEIAVDHCTIVPDEARLGHTQWSAGQSVKIHDQLIAIYAGPIAEARFLNDPIVAAINFYSVVDGDRQMIEAASEALLNGNPAKSLMEIQVHVEMDAQRLVHEFAAALIDELASFLLKKLKLTGAEAIEVYSKFIEVEGKLQRIS